MIKLNQSGMKRKPVSLQIILEIHGDTVKETNLVEA
jgi:hypothetical protein